jgi:uncharacterized Zn finger protein
MIRFTEEKIRRYADAQSFARGEEYYRQGAVLMIEQQGDTLQAQVEGSDIDPYDIIVTFADNGEIDADCDCPYDQGGWCKHIVAVLLDYLNDPLEEADLATLETILAPLNREALQNILLRLAESQPKLVAEIKSEIAKLPHALVSQTIIQGNRLSSPVTSPPATLAPTHIRKQVRLALKATNSSRDYDQWDDDGSDRLTDLEEGITPLIELADALVEAGDGRGALPTLEAITDELVDGWDMVEDVIGEPDELFEDLGRAWAEALLSADLTPQEREDWAERLQAWWDAGGFDGLEVAVEAATQGWDYPPLVRVLQGEITDKGAWEDEPADCADALAIARLNVLERQGRWQEAANLAEAESQDARYMTLLIKLGRAQEAVEVGMKVLTSANAALALAKTLQESGETTLAVRIAEHGFGLSSPFYPLAIWLRDTALAIGDIERAIRIAQAAVREYPNLSDYIQLQEMAGEQWPSMREAVLTDVRTSKHYDVSSRVDIFLREKLWEDALHAVRDSWDYALVARVVEILTSELPLQVLPICTHQAARIMDAGKADRYHYAAEWVGRARNAYRAAGQESQWQEYKASLLATHHRKYKLVPMLRSL